MSDTAKQLGRRLSAQEFTDITLDNAADHYRGIARAYAETENVIAVLSDLKTNCSYVYYGKAVNMLAIDAEMAQHRIPTIWEEEIFRIVHPDDLRRKHLEELKFFDFVSSLPIGIRGEHYLQSHLRMLSKSGAYVTVRHRIFYFCNASKGSVRLALCLYNVAPDMRSATEIINSVTGETIDLTEHNCTDILSHREIEVLRLVEQGISSKQIASLLHRSVHTVNRHRQNIIEKLRVANSTEACKVAKDLGLL